MTMIFHHSNFLFRNWISYDHSIPGTLKFRFHFRAERQLNIYALMYIPVIELSLDIDSFMDELDRHISTTGILTYLSERGTETWDVTRKGEKLFLGTNSSQNSRFRAILTRTIKNSQIVSVILRSFTTEKDPLSGFPVKELRGYLLSVENDHLKWYMIDAEDLMESHNTDSLSGDKLEPEQSVIYCGPNDRCIDSGGREILTVTIASSRTK